ncbi:MAG TPA: hypothetical protein VIF81_10280 [Pyrinomonadaceae bacterium]|jgi:hypothetical protein
MNSAVTKQQIESALAVRFGDVFERHGQRWVETLTTGVSEIDDVVGGFPRGAITEIRGAASSGRTSLLFSGLAAATTQEEICAVIDCSDTFDLSSAVKAGVDFERLLWVRCGHSLERAFKAVDLILHAGGFGCVALSLCDVSAKAVRQIISSWWFRFRRAIENTSTSLIVLTPVSAVRSCAALALEMKNERTIWPGTVSLVSSNDNGDFKNAIEAERRLSLVATPAAKPHVYPAHTHFLRSMQIRANRQRPIDWSAGAMRFNPQLH